MAGVSSAGAAFCVGAFAAGAAGAVGFCGAVGLMTSHWLFTRYAVSPVSGFVAVWAGDPLVVYEKYHFPRFGVYCSFHLPVLYFKEWLMMLINAGVQTLPAGAVLNHHLFFGLV